MNIEELRDYCLCMDNVSESMPFGPDHIVFKVYDRMFLLADMFPFEEVLLKCDPDTAIELRDRYSEITPAFHMNKKHWNGVSVRGSLTDDFIKEQIVNSYNLVLAKVPKNKKECLEK